MSTAAGELAVLCVPGAGENPYQALLAEALAARGVRLRLAPLSWRVFDDARPEERVLHLHWLAPLLFDERAAPTALKLAFFARGLRALQARGVALVWTVHNLYEHERRHLALERRLRRHLARTADALVVHGPAAAARVREEYGVPDAADVAVVPHGHYVGLHPSRASRAEARRRLGLDERAPALLFLGQIRAHKGVRALVEAVAALEGVQLVVAGQPSSAELADDLRAAARGLARVRLRLERVPDDEVGELAAACDLFVLPHEDVLTSGSAVLAMSLARPCVAPRNGCFAELFGEGGAFLHEGSGPDALAGALRAALAARERWEDMGRRNRAAVARNGWERVAAETAAVYARAAERRLAARRPVTRARARAHGASARTRPG